MIGLSSDEASESRQKNGFNKFETDTGFPLLQSLKGVVLEPMFILLAVVCAIYFLLGKSTDGIIMLVAMLLVASISFYQESRSKSAIKRLRKLTHHRYKVLRDSQSVFLGWEDIVVGDVLFLDEGSIVPADLTILESNDFSVDESIITGESLPVFKSSIHTESFLYQGTSVTSGMAKCVVKLVGSATRLGQIGESMEAILHEKSVLQKQIAHFVKMMSVVGIVFFLLVWVINYSIDQQILPSLLKALTLAMSILPEEIPVAFTTFMAIGAWRLSQQKVLVKHSNTVEALGSATIICVDKTGTITQNQLAPAQFYLFAANQIFEPEDYATPSASELLEYAVLASEPKPFDAMELVMHHIYSQHTNQDDRIEHHMVHEYPLAGRPPMMTHLYEGSGHECIVAAKGAPEAILQCCQISKEQLSACNNALAELTGKGYRVLAVAKSKWPRTAEYPATQQEFPFQLLGFISFYDPPKEGIDQVLNSFKEAGITAKILTGDNPTTAQAIARQIHFHGADKVITGDELMALNENEFKQVVLNTHLFARMHPEAKLKVVEALKEHGEIVAMTGDGVNDGPALKAAHIGIAMGKRGTELAKLAATLILVDDDLGRMTHAIAAGRRIYSNLRKAIRYIISIHIPIILTVLLPLIFGWEIPTVFFPVHIIILELIMGPTCSIIYENEPIEEEVMHQPPRPYTHSLFSVKELALSIIQGSVIALFTLLLYYRSMVNGDSESVIRTVVFTHLIFANVFLTLVNRSFIHTIGKTIRYKNSLLLIILLLALALLMFMLFVPVAREFLGFELIPATEFLIISISAAISVFWLELWKLTRKRNPISEK